MRVQQTRSSKHQVGLTKSIPAPVGGLNARDSIAAMDKKDAVTLNNIFPLPTELMVRKGSLDWATGITGTVNSLCQYNPPSGSNKLFACAGANIYDVTAQGAVGAAVVTGQTSDKNEHVNFATAGGHFLYLVNGADKPRFYNGATWTAVDAASTPAITGVTTTLLTHVMSHQSRLWFIEKSSMRVWYLPTLSNGGAASAFDFSSVFSRGGYLTSFASWSLDAGVGLDDHAAFITSEGEVAIYKGTDPSSAATWSKIGVFQIGAPIGKRCLQNIAGDVIAITQDGLVAFSSSLLTARVTNKAAVTDKIQNAIGTAISSYGTNFGWETCIFFGENLLILNVPSSSTESTQYVMNLQENSKSWCTFTGWNAACWEFSSNQIFYGTSGKVVKAWTGKTDNSAVIVGEVVTAFNYFGNDSQLKQATLCRPIISTDGSPSILIGIDTDFFIKDPTGILSFVATTSSMVWGSMIWGSMVWGGGLSIKNSWQYASGLGYSLALHMKIQNNASDVRWQSWDILLKGGGVL